jgi:hypothetical protein
MATASVAGELNDVRRARLSVDRNIETLREQVSALRGSGTSQAVSADLARRAAVARARRAQLEALYRDVGDATTLEGQDLRFAAARRALDIRQDYQASLNREQAIEEEERVVRQDADRAADRVAQAAELFDQLANLRQQSSELRRRQDALESTLATIDSGARLARPAHIVTAATPLEWLAWLTLGCAAIALATSWIPIQSNRYVPSVYSRFRLPGRRRQATTRVSRAA